MKIALGALLVVVVFVIGQADAQPSLERGKYLVEVIAACGNCHTPKGQSGEEPGKHMAGGFRIKEGFGVAIAPNITPDRETGIGSWSDQQIARAIREGKGRDGRDLGPPMPFSLYRGLADTDVEAMVAYLRTLPAIKHSVPRSRYLIKFWPTLIGAPGVVHAPPRNDLVKYGAYLTGPVAHCSECHTPDGPDGRMDPTRLFAGGRKFTGPWGASYASNLTPDRETGIGAWTDAQLIAGIYGIKRNGQPVLPPMPSPYYAGRIAEGDLRAIIAYLRSRPPLRNVVAPPESPTR
jgi:mono/diheme cytochrome c family protein